MGAGGRAGGLGRDTVETRSEAAPGRPSRLRRPSRRRRRHGRSFDPFLRGDRMGRPSIGNRSSAGDVAAVRPTRSEIGSRRGPGGLNTALAGRPRADDAPCSGMLPVRPHGRWRDGPSAVRSRSGETRRCSTCLLASQPMEHAAFAEVEPPSRLGPAERSGLRTNRTPRPKIRDAPRRVGKFVRRSNSSAPYLRGRSVLCKSRESRRRAAEEVRARAAGEPSKRAAEASRRRAVAGRERRVNRTGSMVYLRRRDRAGGDEGRT